MSGSIVNVLTPNGRRQNVKVQPNTAILKVLEEVCEKHKFDSNEYDLKHHKRILDLTTSFRFSGLPNNAQLEMVEAQKKRVDVEVELVVQLGDGTRLDGKFKSNTTLLSIIQQLCPNEITGDDLFVIYMRTEVASDKLESTTLKDLGLISGRAIVRIVHRDPNAAKIQANVALNLQPKPNETKEETCETKQESSGAKVDESQIKMRKTENESKLNTPFSLMIQSEIEKKKKELAAQDLNQAQQLGEECSGEIGRKLATSNEDVHEMPEKEEKMEVEPPSEAQEAMEAEEDADNGEIHILGDRNAVLFTKDAAKAANLSDLPDSFFDLNVNDLKLLIKDLRTQAVGTVDQPLMTAKLREMEEEQKQLSLLNRYNTVIIRIQFPNRYVLQGTFTPYETIDTVIGFVRAYLISSDIEFYLYTTPPKSILLKESRLFEANCVPSAILHFGSEEKRTNYLKEDILDKISSPRASLLQALNDRGIKQTSNISSHMSSTENKPSTSQQTRKSNASNFSSASNPSTSGDAKLPKWFKPFGK